MTQRTKGTMSYGSELLSRKQKFLFCIKMFYHFSMQMGWVEEILILILSMPCLLMT